MAIVKHSSSKNARYSDVLEYYSYQHTEDPKTKHYEPILDENGLMIERQNYAVLYITADGNEETAEKWAAACMRTNVIHKKNQRREDRKIHEYILSHPEEDRKKMSMEDLRAEGIEFAKKYLAGYDVLIAIHRDTDNDHIHISINSVRARERAADQEWMMRDNEGNTLPSETKAGGKHQDGARLRRHMNDWLMQYTKEHEYAVKDNNAIADKHRRERYGGKNNEMRAALLEAARRSANIDDLQRILKAEYNMDLKVSESGKTISVLYPGNQKYVRLRTLGIETADLVRLFKGPEYDFEKAFIENEAENVTTNATEGVVQGEFYSIRPFVDSRTRKPYRVSLYDEYGRRRGTLELLLVLAIVVLKSESGRWNSSAVPAGHENDVIYAPTNWKIQKMLDSVSVAREEGIADIKQLEERISAAGVEYGQAKSALAAATNSGDHDGIDVLEQQVEKTKKQYYKLSKLRYNAMLAANAQYCYGPLYYPERARGSTLKSLDIDR